MRRLIKAVVTTTIRLRFDCDSTALRPFDDLRYDRQPIPVRGLLHWGLNKWTGQRATASASGLRHCDLNDLWWAVEWPSNGRRITAVTTAFMLNVIDNRSMSCIRWLKQ